MNNICTKSCSVFQFTKWYNLYTLKKNHLFYLIEEEKNHYADNFRLLRKYFISFVQSVHHHVKVPATDFHPKIIRQCCDNFFDCGRGWGYQKHDLVSFTEANCCKQVTVKGLFSSWILPGFFLKHLQANSADVSVSDITKCVSQN